MSASSFDREDEARREARAAIERERRRIDALIEDEARRLTEDFRQITGRDDFELVWVDDE